MAIAPTWLLGACDQLVRLVPMAMRSVWESLLSEAIVLTLAASIPFVQRAHFTAA
jgi:hypothetical protein